MGELDNKKDEITQVQDEQDTNHPLIGIDVTLIDQEENMKNNEIDSKDKGNILTSDVQHEENIDLNASSDVPTTEEVLASGVMDIQVTHFICSLISDHKYQYLQEKTQSDWCKPNARFHGVKCQGCTKIFVHVKGDIDKTYKPSVRKQLWSCPNEKQKCTYAICADCQLKESIKDSLLSKQVINKDEELNNDMEVNIEG